MEQLEDYVKDYILEARDDDPILDKLVSLVLTSQITGVDIFPTTLGLLDRPALFETKIRPWILEGIEEYQRILNVSKEG